MKIKIKTEKHIPEYKITENETKDIWEIVTRGIKDDEHEFRRSAAENTKTS